MADRTIPTASSTGQNFMNKVAEKVGYLFDNICLIPTSITNTGNDFTISVDPMLDGDVKNGMCFLITFPAANTGTVRIRVTDSNPYYALLTLEGIDLNSGDISNGSTYLCAFTNGAFRAINLINIGNLSMPEREVFTSSGTWNKPTSLPDSSLIMVEAWGGGGQADAGKGGGGGGGYNRDYFRLGDLPSSVAVTIGAGGTGDGGNTTFGAYLLANGGKKPTVSATGGAGGGAGPDNIMGGGWNGGAGGITSSGPGGNSLYGGGGGGGWAGGLGGKSLYGGNGGNAQVAAGDAPGGGGGMNYGLGARGELRITYFV